MTIPELILGVGIVLGTADLAACRALDQSGDEQVGISDLVLAVNRAQGEDCRPVEVTVSGSCLVPGPGGLSACADGTAIRVFRCDERSNCLVGGGRTLLKEGNVTAGVFSIVLDRDAASEAALVVEAEVADATIIRVIDIGPPGVRPVGGRAADLMRLDISPATEAAVQILAEEGLENFTDDGIVAVVEAVETAAADVDFSGLDTGEAVEAVLGDAAGDPVVDQVVQGARFTPTPTSTGTVTSTPTVTVTATRTPTSTPPSGFAYVALSTSLNPSGVSSVAIIDLEQGRSIGVISVGVAPLGVTGTPDREWVLVANSESNSVSFIRTAANSVHATVRTDEGPTAIAMTADGRLAYVTCNRDDSVNVIDIAAAIDGDPSDAVVGRFAVGAAPIGIAVAPDRPTALVANSGDRTLSVIDTDDRAVIETLPLARRPFGIDVTADGSTAYVGTGTFEEDGNEEPREVYAISTNLARVDPSRAVIGTLTAGSFPGGLAVSRESPDSPYVYVVNSGSESVSIVDRRIPTDGGQVLPESVPLQSGSRPAAVAVSRDGALGYVTNCPPNRPGSVTVFDTEEARTNPGANLRTITNVGECPQGIAIIE